ncbi:Ig-like domain-containing protein [Arthrobacter sp. STN4]|uniref:Ig-like domain-containing protein n=1 Tax=Arthrobacter sp. STN4 TaxID=2923276 RepID=UPI00211A0854|nr:Ig-like domain-containing protein [Arthrobacter sp. STN4]MCQ9163401.1 Ig-like domain-containing protein [Arthrobacter sp. STN4]
MAFNRLLPTSTNRRQVFTASAALAVCAAVVAGAMAYPGFTTADVALNDGSVWVTNHSDGLVGHLNDQSQVLDGGFTATAAGFDVVQNAGNVFMSDSGGTVLNPVDLPLMDQAAETRLGGGMQASAGTNTVALTNPGQGKVWAVAAQNVPSFNARSTTPIATGLTHPVSVTAPDDTIYTVDAKTGVLLTTSLNSDGTVASQDRTTVAGLAGLQDVQLTLAGNQPVEFSPSAGKLFLPGGRQAAVADAVGAVVQQPSADGTFVAVETGRGLATQPLDGSAATVLPLPSTGKAIAPVVQGSCVHAAWSGANKYVRACGGQGTLVDIPHAGGQAQFVFRKNRDVVVLNDVNGGNVWLVNQNMVLVNNWNDLKVNLRQAQDANRDSADPNVVNTLPDRTKPNRPPIAKPDDFGVRAGATTLLPVLYNDSDPDGDVLTVQGEPEKTALGTVQPVYGGTGLQVTVPPGATGTQTFNYTADDGRGGTASAPVTVHVVPASANNAPVSRRATSIVVSQGASITQNVLSDMIDPDGDEFFLVGAKAGDATAQVKTTPDGQLTYADNGQGSGARSVTITVSDGRATTEKKISVNVKPAGSVPPVANADHVRVVAGESVKVAPLANDQDPAGGQLRLASVGRAATATTSAPADDGTFTFNSSTPGAVYLTYQVTNGPQSATGLIRVDVVSADASKAPIAVKDTAMLPAGGTAVVDVLGNDTDPSGGVLVARSVDAPATAGVSAAVVDHHLVKISDVNDPGRPVQLHYTVANAFGTSTGIIDVVRIPSPATLQPPVAKPDTAVVRAGDVVRIPVLANDSDPNGNTLKNPAITQAPDASRGRLWVDQDSLRFLAGAKPGPITAVYKVTNSSGQSDSATVTINIIAPDPAHNLPPAPKDVEGRVIAGGQERIVVPLDGIDPDGDSVQLTGIDKAPVLGTAVAGNGYINYVAAGNSAGTDTFTYTVRDRLGASATGTVRVGIAPQGSTNHPPQAQDDYLTVRPNRQVAVNVTANDTDPDGDPLAVVKNGFHGPSAMKPRVGDQGGVVVTSPAESGIATMGYTVADPSGATAQANIRMTVSPTAPLKAPIARDDFVTAAQALGKNTVDVPVLRNDEDPDGVASDLSVAVDPAHAKTATVTASGTVRVTLAQAPQMIPYTVTDPDRLSSTAIIWVPGLGSQYPVLAKTTPITVQAGQSASLKLSDYVKVRAGHTPRLTQADKITLIGAPSTNAATGNGDGIIYRADQDFYGPGSITFEVTDGTGPDDPAGLKSTLTVMTTVTPAPSKNLPPRFNGTQLDVAQDESAVQDLARLAKDPENDPLQFKLAGAAPPGFKAALSGSRLTVTASADARPGVSGSIAVSASDGHNPPVTANIVVTATSSTRPKAVANDDVVPDAQAGRPATANVLANDVNPFPDTPLKVIGTQLESGGAGITVSHTDSTVTVNSGPDFKGTVVVRYSVQDKTKDAARVVNGRLTVTIKGRPDTPQAPRILEEKDKAVSLGWPTPADNGSPITSYTVAWAGGSQQCGANTCVITGLKNAQSYTFTASATNAVGTSAPSGPSATAVPDAAPDAPGAPMVTFGDQSVALSWNTPVGDYSAVTHYTVEISPAPAGQNPQRSDVKGNTLTWTGLANGTTYQFRVQAWNKARKPSGFSPYSAGVVPAGKPGRPAAPQINGATALGSQSQLQVGWNPPDSNGAPIAHYTLRVLRGGTVVNTIQTAETMQTVNVDNSQTPYSFDVSATNKAGTGTRSAASTAQRAVGKPAMMNAPRLTATNTSGAGGQVRVDFTPLSANQMNGYSPGEISYCVNLGGTDHCGVSSGVLLPASNGQSIRATVYAVGSTGSSSTAGDASAPSNAVTPYGVPSQVSVNGGTSSRGDTAVHWSWQAPASNGRAISGYQVNTGSGWNGVGMATSYSEQTGKNGQSRTLSVRACNLGGCGAAGSATSTSGPPAQWETSLNPGVVSRSCTESSPTSRDWSADHYCQGTGGNWAPYWEYPGQNMVVRCYINRVDPSGATPYSNGNVVPYFLIEPGSYQNVGRYVEASHTYLGGPPSGMGPC